MHPRLLTIPAIELLGRSIGPFTLHTYGVLLAIAFLAGLWVVSRQARRAGLDANRITDMAVWVLIAGLIGAKVLLVAVDWRYFGRNPREIGSILQSGGVFYGGLIGGILVAVWYVRRHRLPGWQTADVLAPGVALGQAIGRLGCFAAGCCWGRPTQVPWAVTFTDVYSARAVGTPMDTPVHPSQLYESFAAFLLFLFLLWLAPRKRFDGQVVLAYVALYSAVRFGLEFLRGDPDRGSWFGGTAVHLPAHRHRPAARGRACSCPAFAGPARSQRPRTVVCHSEELRPCRATRNPQSRRPNAAERHDLVVGPGATDETLVVGAEATGRRLDSWLAQRLPSLSRARLQALIVEGHVLLDGARARASARLRAGQAARVHVPAPAPAVPQAEDIPIAVVHEDAHLVVVNKPAGLVVHPGAGTPGGTLVNALLGHVRDLSGVGGVLRPGIVHRLDKGTSGLLVVAKDDETHRSLVRQFAGRTVEKEYLALVLGVPSRPQGEIDAPIGRDPGAPAEDVGRARRAGARPAATWRIEERFDGAALLRVRIHTGRTHQIRVHLASVGHPVAGDATYGGSRTPSSRRAAAREALSSLDRPALHAARLALTHPANGKRLEFEAPLPADLIEVLERLRAASQT